MGGDAPNPVIEVPLDAVSGRWVRFGGSVPDPSIGMQFRVNVYRGERILTQSVPSLCDASGRCSAIAWIPRDATRVQAVAWAQAKAGVARDLTFETGAAASVDFDDRMRVDRFVTKLRSEYYRTDEADWTTIERRVDAMAPAPSDVDPLPTVAQYVRDQLPGNKHMFVVPATFAKTSASTAPVPTCSESDASIGLVVVPGISATEGDGPVRYAKTLQDCLMASDQERPWVIDLRGNGGGNMYPMISGVGPLLPPGPLYAFVDGAGKATARIGITASGITANDHEVATVMPVADVGRRTRNPVIVLFGPRCGSSCEQVANALAARPRTLSVGQDTAGYTSVNYPYPLNDDYVLLLTSGYTADPCGRPIADRVHPDVVVDRIDERAIAEVLAMPAIREWLASMRERSSLPVAEPERRTRCAPAAG